MKKLNLVAIKVVMTGIFLAFCCNFFYVPLQAKSISGLIHAKYLAVLDGKTNHVLVEQSGTSKVPMASTTKILTCILALENGNEKELVTVSKKAALMPPVKMGIQKEETYYLGDLLHALMLESYNDVAVAIAEHISGSVEEFAILMNEKAKSIGCQSYCFLTPNGLDQTVTEGSILKDHGISAIDLGKIMNYCCEESPQKERFIEINRTRECTIYRQGKESRKAFMLHNHNQLLSDERILCGKTGFTAKAGYCYVCCAKIHGQYVSIVLLACGWPPHKNYKWNDVKNVLSYLEASTEKETVTIPKAFPKPYAVNGQHEIGKNVCKWEIPTKVSCEKYTFLRNKDEKLFIRINMREILKLPIKKDEILGKVIWKLGDEVINETPIKSRLSIKENNYWTCFLQCVLMCILCV